MRTRKMPPEREDRRLDHFFRKHIGRLILSSLIILVPAAAGLFLWNRLPAQMPIHWNASGAANRYAPKGAAVIGIPALLLLVHWVCLLIIRSDRRSRSQSEQILNVIFWLMPAVSLLAGGLLYSSALGFSVDSNRMMVAVLGLLFLVIGSFLPKTTPNSSIGIRLRWTENDGEAWHLTHRLEGIVWPAGGIVMILTAFLPEGFYGPVLFADLVLMAAVPTLYSRHLSRKKMRGPDGS